MGLLCLTGCNKEDEIRSNDFGSKLEVSGDYKLSSFVLANSGLGLLGVNEQLQLHLSSLSNSQDIIFNGKISKTDASSVHCVMMIPRREWLADGDYLLKISKELISKAENSVFLNMQFQITIKDEMLSKVLSSNFIYTELDGLGTSAENPYKIGSTKALEAFFYLLRMDPSHGKGSFFKQTADFDGPQQGDGIDGRGFANQIFAGTYDGGGHKITFSYIGAKNATKDNAIGLFNKLEDGVTIKNLNLLADFEQVCDTIGVVAAWAEGNILLDGVHVVNGSNIINAGNGVGGLIGVMKNGILQLNKCSSMAKIDDAGNDVGGLVGKADNVKIELGGTVISEGFKHLKGKDQVGGLIGSLTGDFAIQAVTLKHTVPEEDRDLKILEGTGINVGGLIGLVNMTGPCSVYNATIALPVNGVNNVGGLFGQIDGRNHKLTIDYCYVRKDGNRVQGRDNVGGYVGIARAGVIFSGMENWQSAQVIGSANVGGFFGTYDNSSLSVEVEMHMTGNVSGSTANSTNIGGFAGLLKTHSIDLTKFVFPATIEIHGYANVGGFAGTCENTSISGVVSVQFSDKTVVAPNMLSAVSPNFSAVINKDEPFKSKAQCVGGLIGWASGVTLKSVYTTATVSGDMFVGGVVGMATETVIAGCVSKSLINGGSAVGGIVGGFSASRQQECNQNISYSTVHGTFSVGGIAGNIEKELFMDKNVNMGDITGQYNVGGLAGFLEGTANTISQSANYGTISGTSPIEDSGIGGIVGRVKQKMTIKNSVNHGPVKIIGGSNSHKSGIGGILGVGGEGAAGWDRDNIVKILECCNMGTVSVPSYSNENYMGGIVGMFQAGTVSAENMVVRNCYNNGAINGKSKYDNGGIIGLMNNCNYADRSVNIGKVEHGNGGAGCNSHLTDAIHTDYLYALRSSGTQWREILFTESAKGSQGSFAGLDFNAVWKIDSEYPYLQNCYFQFAKP